jgi:hypothetical protein
VQDGREQLERTDCDRGVQDRLTEGLRRPRLEPHVEPERNRGSPKSNRQHETLSRCHLTPIGIPNLFVQYSKANPFFPDRAYVSLRSSWQPKPREGSVMMADGKTKELTRSGVCPTHGAVQATKRVPVFEPPGLFWVFQSVASIFKPYRCPQCGSKVAGA